MAYISESPEITVDNESFEITEDPEITTVDAKITTINENSETAIDESTQSATTDNKKCKRNNLNSWVFKESHFAKDPKQMDYTRCTHCNNSLKHNNDTGTSSLIRHMKKTNCKKYLKDESQQTLKLSTSGLTILKFSQEQSCNDFTQMVLRHSYPFSMAEHEGFLTFVGNLQLQFKIVSVKTVREDCMNIIKEFKVKARIMLQEATGRLSYTTDLWTSNQTLGYIVVTCHFINKVWKLQNIILAFKLIPAPHTGIAIIRCFDEWNVISKTLAITTDNATNNDTAMADLKDKLEEQGVLVANRRLLRQRCCAHVLNLIVCDSLKKIKSIVSKIRECVKWKSSSQA